MIDASRTARRIESDLRQAGTPERAEGEKRYLKSDLTFLGVRLPEIRAAARAVAKTGDLDRDGLVDLATELWRKPVFERRMAAVILLERHGEVLGPGDLPVIEAFLRDSKTWALVDPLAVNVVGDMVLRHRIKQKLDRWARDPDFWARRASLLAELQPLKHGAPFARSPRAPTGCSMRRSSSSERRSAGCSGRPRRSARTRSTDGSNRARTERRA